MNEIPMGLSGVNPRDPVGVHIAMSRRDLTTGTPKMGGRFWMMTYPTHSSKFSTVDGKKSWTAPARDPHPRFRIWNGECEKLGEELDPLKGAGRVMMLRGNIVHARWEDAAGWNRSAQKLPAGHLDADVLARAQRKHGSALQVLPNPTLSRRPGCEGNGIWARRFVGNLREEEVFERIACPNNLCPFAMNRLCKPDTNLNFKLRWNEADAWESQFPALLAHWHTGGWESTAALMGLFEYVLGTEQLLSPEDRAQATEEDRAGWKAGFAAALGLRGEDLCLVGLPFVMSIHWRTKSADATSPAGKRFPVVAFSTDGDLEAWLVAQHQRRVLLSGIAPSPAALPPAPASVRDPDFLDGERHEVRAEAAVIDLLPAVDGPVLEKTPVRDPLPAQPAGAVKLLQPGRVEYLQRQAEQLAGSPEAGAALFRHTAEHFHSKGDLSKIRASEESEILRKMRELAGMKKP